MYVWLVYSCFRDANPRGMEYNIKFSTRIFLIYKLSMGS